jgi:methionine sulfoxide reductase catalytic subunit
MGWQAVQPAGDAVSSFHLVRLVRGLHSGYGVMVFVTGIRQNTNHMFGGVDNASWTGFPLFVLAMAVLAIAWLLVSPFTICTPSGSACRRVHDRLDHGVG